MADHSQPELPRETTAPAAFSNLSAKPIEEEMLELVDSPVRQKKSLAEANQLPDQFQRELVQMFKLLSDETRLRVLMYLYRENELHVSALCERLQQSQPAVSHHLALLREAGLIGCRRDGKHNFYSIRQTHFHRVVAQLFQNIADPGKPEFQFDEFTVTPSRKSGA